jgi:hypothetical protein
VDRFAIKFQFQDIAPTKTQTYNVHALSKNPASPVMDNNDFSEEIQDSGSVQVNTPRVEDKIFSIQTSN